MTASPSWRILLFDYTKCARPVCDSPPSYTDYAAGVVSPQAMNNVLRALQDRGIVTRPASVPSGRALPAELTSKGKALLDRAEAAVRGADEQVLANLTRAQQRQLRRLLDAAAPPGLIPA
jgi:hypothetical protein